MASSRRIGFIAIGGVAFFLLGYLAHFLINNYINSTITETGIREKGKYTYIAPLLYCSSTERKDYGPFNDLNNKVQAVIDQKIKDGLAEKVSVFFRDTKAHWIGINDSDLYSPASLLKVPLMIAYYKEAENDPSILEQRYTYPTDSDLNANEVFKPKKQLTPGASYSVSELIEAMITESDNNAADILQGNINQKILSEVYTDLGLPIADHTDPNKADMSPKMYTYFLRVLYNATYLSPTYSEQALSFLAKSSFDQGLRLGIQDGTAIASKFGERTEIDQNGMVLSKNLNDCGLIYAKNDPYFLCVMTKGQDYKGLSSTIGDISKVVYQEVLSQK